MVLTVVRATVMLVAGSFTRREPCLEQDRAGALHSRPAGDSALGNWPDRRRPGDRVSNRRSAHANRLDRSRCFSAACISPCHPIPSWLGAIANVTPLAYGLNALRRVLIQGESLAAVAPDVAILAAIGAVLLAIGAMAIRICPQVWEKGGDAGDVLGQRPEARGQRLESVLWPHGSGLWPKLFWLVDFGLSQVQIMRLSTPGLKLLSRS